MNQVYNLYMLRVKFEIFPAKKKKRDVGGVLLIIWLERTPHSVQNFPCGLRGNPYLAIAVWLGPFFLKKK